MEREVGSAEVIMMEGEVWGVGAEEVGSESERKSNAATATTQLITTPGAGAVLFTTFLRCCTFPS